MHPYRLVLAALLACAAFFAGCSSPSYTYRYVPGKTATLVGGYAAAPEKAPERVKIAIAAANGIVGSPYVYGGGHGRGGAGFDCSGTASHVLIAAGLLDSPTPSRGFRSYGRSGSGEWISVYARKGHVFLVIAGLRLDTGYNGEGEGPRWSTRSRPAKGAVIRHPVGV
ncbi:MAG: peptidoglycan endopeptidase [Chthoniobacteraceae bacterium]